MLKQDGDKELPEKCDGCNSIIEGKVLTALGKSYHPEHFVCAECKKPITDTSFKTNEGRPYCDRDYNEMFARKCHSCREPIRDQKIVKALGHDWHENHFTCYTCNKSLVGSSFMERDGLPYCQADYLQKFAEKCCACKLPIQGQAVIALDNKYHEHCFKCARCMNPIKDGSFMVVDGRSVCSRCA